MPDRQENERMKLKDGTTGPFEAGDKVLYIPKDLLMGDRSKMMQEENLGVVRSKNEKYVFVQYIGNTNTKGTLPTELYPVHGRPDLVKIIEQNIK